MRTQLLEIQPNILNFIFEANKLSSCSIQLTNNSGDHVAFKVKTTSPKKYSVRPNVGLVLPYSTCKFLVTMRAQPIAPVDMLCVDKFLVQSTIVPASTVEDDINSSMFLKDAGKYVEEKRLSVILISPPTSPVLSPINMAPKDADLKRQGVVLKGPYYGTSEVKNQLMTDVYTTDTQKSVVDEFAATIEEDLEPEKVTEKIVKESRFVNEDDSKPVKVIEMILEEPPVIDEDESEPMKETETEVESSKMINEDESKPMKVTEMDVVESKVINKDESKSMNVIEKVLEKSAVCKGDELTPAEGIENVVEPSEINEIEILPAKVTELEKEKKITAVKDDQMLKLIQNIKDMKSNLAELELKLNKAQNTISELTESRQISIQEFEVLKQRLVELNRRGERRAHIGLPLLFLCMVAVISIILRNLMLHQ